MKIKTKILLTVVLLSLFINAISISIYATGKRNDLLNILHLKIENNDQLLKNINSKLLYNLDILMVEIILESFLNDIDIVSIKLIDTEDNSSFNFEFKENNYDKDKTIIKTTTLKHGGEELGSIITQYTTNNIDLSLSKSIKQIVISFIWVTLLILLALYILLSKLTKPITDLTKISSLIASGNLENNINISSNDEIGKLSKTFEYMRVSLKERIQLINIQKEEIETFNKDLQSKVDKRTQALNLQTKKLIDLLNNASQGFLSFNKNFLIGNEYSLKCEYLLGKNLKNKDITELLFANYSKNIPFYKETMDDALNSNNELTSSLLLSLLPRELIINKRAILIEYKIISRDKIMIILTNITDKKKLQNKIKKEHRIHKMIITTVIDSVQFFELKKNFEEFSCDILLYINFNNSVKENANTINALVHTFKGLFAQLYMEGTVKQLHFFESKISSFIEDEKKNVNDLKNFIESFDFKNYMSEDIETIIKMLGDNFMKEDSLIKINEDLITYLEDKLASFCSLDIEQKKECKEIMHEIKKIKYKSFKYYLLSYQKLCKQLCLSLNKSIYNFEIDGSSELYISNKYKPFINSLVHVFRNCCDHGIETKDHRINLNKDERGTINCSFQSQNDILYIKITDDGKGIDIDILKKEIEQKKLIPTKEIELLSEKEILSFIFDNNFSTNNTINHISGRGIGLSAVKMELDKLNGDIDIQTKINEGTSFIFRLPLNNI